MVTCSVATLHQLTDAAAWRVQTAAGPVPLPEWRPYNRTDILVEVSDAGPGCVLMVECAPRAIGNGVVLVGRWRAFKEGGNDGR